MTREEAIEAYANRFGGFPYFLFMGASDEKVIEAVERALRKDEPIRTPEGRVY